jgi:hypothetical protein
MAMAHNMFMRGLNSIYLQAPHVAKKDDAAFVRWTLLWCKSIGIHHHNEEHDFFPAIEKMTGQPHIMDGNIEQHHAFHPGLEELERYCNECVGDMSKFEGKRIVEIIDSFGPVLREHLHAEIDTLLSLEKFGDQKMAGLEAALDHDAETSMVRQSAKPNEAFMLTHTKKALGLFSALPAMLFCHDVEYENGLWRGWPQNAPTGLFWTCRNISSWAIAGPIRFSACDKSGKMQPLYALRTAA